MEKSQKRRSRSPSKRDEEESQLRNKRADSLAFYEVPTTHNSGRRSGPFTPSIASTGSSVDETFLPDTFKVKQYPNLGDTDECEDCNKAYSFFSKKDFCRMCGKSVCNNCCFSKRQLSKEDKTLYKICNSCNQRLEHAFIESSMRGVLKKKEEVVSEYRSAIQRLKEKREEKSQKYNYLLEKYGKSAFQGDGLGKIICEDISKTEQEVDSLTQINNEMSVKIEIAKEETNDVLRQVEELKNARELLQLEFDTVSAMIEKARNKRAISEQKVEKMETKLAELERVSFRVDLIGLKDAEAVESQARPLGFSQTITTSSPQSNSNTFSPKNSFQKAQHPKMRKEPKKSKCLLL